MKHVDFLGRDLKTVVNPGVQDCLARTGRSRWSRWGRAQYPLPLIAGRAGVLEARSLAMYRALMATACQRQSLAGGPAGKGGDATPGRVLVRALDGHSRRHMLGFTRSWLGWLAR